MTLAGQGAEPRGTPVFRSGRVSLFVRYQLSQQTEGSARADCDNDRPAQTKRFKPTMLSPWAPYAHTIPHTFDTSRYIPLSTGHLLPFVHSPSRTVYTGRHTGGTGGRETVTPESVTRHLWRTSVLSRSLNVCDPVPHGAHRVSNNARFFECTLHGSPCRVECTVSSRRPCNALLGPVQAALLLHRPTWRIPSATS
jgi:hypothetical protein